MKDNNLYTILTLLSIVVFAALQYPSLNLPYFGDEAWVYGSAVRILADHPLSLMPDALPLHYSRGHPLLFYFLTASWLKILGNTIFQSHLFMLLLASLLLWFTFKTGELLFNRKVGFLSAFALILQPIFVAQSAIVLPEITVALFTVLSCYFFLTQKRWLYLCFGTALVLIKESGIILISSLAAFQFFKGIKQPKELIKEIAITIVPFLFFALFLWVQKKHHGWFFYPEHIGLLKFNIKTFGYTFLKEVSYFLFIDQGRWVQSLLGLASFSFLLQKRKIKDFLKLNRFTLIIGFLMIFMLFSSINFFTKRYVLCLIPFFIILSIGVFNKAITQKWFSLLILPALIVSQWLIFSPKEIGDFNLHYRDAIQANQKAITYLKEQSLETEPIYGSFVMRKNLTNRYVGYVQQFNEFSHVQEKLNPDCRYLIFTNYDQSEMAHPPQKEQADLLKRFEHNVAWAEIYQLK